MWDRIWRLTRATDHFFHDRELQVLHLGELLGTWQKFEFDKQNDGEKFPSTQLTMISKLIEALFKGTAPDRLVKLIEEYPAADWQETQIPYKVYFILRQILSEEELFVVNRILSSIKIIPLAIAVTYIFKSK